jgi:hypothetical protein
MKDIIIQQGSGQYAPLLMLCARRHFAYAARFGMEYHGCNFNMGREWSPHEKFTIPLSYMTASGAAVCVLDADAVIVGELDWRLALHDADFAAVKNAWGEFNNGVFFFRDNAAMRALFEHCCRELPHAMTRRASTPPDQDVLNRNLGRVRVKALGREWNDYATAGGAVSGPVQVKAFHDLNSSPQTKLFKMRDYLSTVPKSITV